MAEDRKLSQRSPRLLWWSVGCVTLNFAIDATVNKYGSHWSDGVIVVLWLLPLIPFAIWIFLHERFLLQRKWIAENFKEHPISFLLIVVLFLVVGVSQTARIVSRFTRNAVVATTVPQPTASHAPAAAPQSQATGQPPAKHTPQEQSPNKAPVPQSTPIAPAAPPKSSTPKADAPLQTPAPPPVTINAPNGIGISGGTVTNPTVNNYGPSEPHMTWTQKPYDLGPTYRPAVIIYMNLDGNLNLPAFLATCDRPCEVQEGSVDSVMTTPGPILHGGPNIAGMIFKAPRPVGMGQHPYLIIESEDNSPVKVLSVVTLTKSQLPAGVE
jgi:hypothetical protein